MIYGKVSSDIVDIDSYYDLDLANLQIGTKYDFLSVHLDKLI